METGDNLPPPKFIPECGVYPHAGRSESCRVGRRCFLGMPDQAYDLLIVHGHYVKIHALRSDELSAHAPGSLGNEELNGLQLILSSDTENGRIPAWDTPRLLALGCSEWTRTTNLPDRGVIPIRIQILDRV